MTGTSEGSRRAWETRRRRYGETGENRQMSDSERYLVQLYDRWLNVHDIRAMGERAVRETG